MPPKPVRRAATPSEYKEDVDARRALSTSGDEGGASEAPETSAAQSSSEDDQSGSEDGGARRISQRSGNQFGLFYQCTPFGCAWLSWIMDEIRQRLLA
jgi:hypothetical protein